MKRWSFWKWLKRLLSGEPHFHIGGVLDPYLKRWFLIPRNGFINVYLHQFLRSDDDRACHDHPWWFISIMLKGRYKEILPDSTIQRSAPSIVFRRATHRHIVILDRDGDKGEIPCWTLVITGRKSREWGFWCPKGFVPWRRFVAHDDEGNVGKGCGE